VMTFPLLVISRRHFPFRLNLSLIVPLIRIGFPSTFGVLAFFIIDYMDRLFLQRYTGIATLGIYSLGYSFGMVLLMAISAFGTAWPPYFNSFIDKQDDACRIFGRILKYYLLGFGALTLLFFAAARPVVMIMTAPPFHEAYSVVGWIALS
jgi:O-antigen/teichoic acid export membrane protein